jgi:hypothetical protein
MRKTGGASKTGMHENHAAILREYREHYRPAGPLEESLVERMATFGWRMTRGSKNSQKLALARTFDHYRRLLENLQSARKAVRRSPSTAKITYPGNTLIN